ELKSIRVHSLPEVLKESKVFVDEATDNGTNWQFYDTDPEIGEMINLYFEKLSAYLANQEKAEAKKTESPKKKNEASTKDSTTRSKPKRTTTQKRAVAKAGKSKVAKSLKTRALKKQNANLPNQEQRLINAYPEEVRLIRRMLNMDGKEKTRHQVLLFINAIQRKITEKYIRKSSPYASHIQFIQEWLIELYNKMGEKVTIQLSANKRSELQALLGEMKIRPSVRLIKRYINLHGKNVEHKRIKTLHNAIANTINKGQISKSDPYYSQLHRIIKSLREFNCEVGKKNKLHIHNQTLRGLQGIVEECECKKHPVKGKYPERPGMEHGNLLTGLGHIQAGHTANRIVNSQDIQRMAFKRLGFTGRWLALIGDPAPGFTAMIFGKPKMGKSYLAIDFAGYLARQHGRVLYVAKEEKIDATIQEKINDKAVAHRNLDFSDFLPDDLRSYDFVFLDSVNKLKLSPEDLDSLREQYPTVSFIFIFQTTKSGNFRGSNDFQHDVDIVIEVPEKGKAVQYGRFNQGGELAIFEEEIEQVS
ncbi:MAG: hypothetical protein WBA74_25375, partial [Cyclobacteriaceae bacterium]